MTYTLTAQMVFDGPMADDFVICEQYDDFPEASKVGQQQACLRASQWVVITGPDGLECTWSRSDNQWRTLGKLAKSLHKRETEDIMKRMREERERNRPPATTEFRTTEFDKITEQESPEAIRTAVENGLPDHLLGLFGWLWSAVHDVPYNSRPKHYVEIMKILDDVLDNHDPTKVEGRAKAIADLRFLAEARKEYCQKCPESQDEMRDMEVTALAVHEEHATATWLADILEGTNTAQGWLPSRRWDEWPGTHKEETTP
jgi:hypothetical protein